MTNNSQLVDRPAAPPTTPADDGRYRVVCWYRDRVTTVSASLPKEAAFALADRMATGRHTPSKHGRAAVVSEEDYAVAPILSAA